MDNITMNKIFTSVSNILYGNNSFENISTLLPKRSKNVIIIKDINVKKNPNLELNSLEIIYDWNKYGEPTSYIVNKIFDNCKKKVLEPSAIIGIGGGSVMDISKAISILYTNQDYKQKTKVEKFQGWNLVDKPGVFKIGIPTIFGSGSEASRTAVLKMKDRKLGINSEFSQFDAIIIDPSLCSTVKESAIFFSAMDCYIHSVESLLGCYKNYLAQVYAEKALALSKNFLEYKKGYDEIAVGSYFGGISIVNSEVGVCHALSYGLSKIFDINHGEANCIIFQHLDQFYGDYCKDFRKYLKNWKVPLTPIPKLTQTQIDEMVTIALKMERPLENALGQGYNIDNISKIFEKIYCQLCA